MIDIRSAFLRGGISGVAQGLPLLPHSGAPRYLFADARGGQAIMIGMMMLAAAFAAPQAVHFENWLNLDDYPAPAAGKVAQISQRLAIVVDPKGKPASCEPLMAQRNGIADWPICNRLLKRSRFTPATEDGRPTWGVWTMTANFWMGSRLSTMVAYDIVVPVNRLPGNGDPQAVTIEQLVDQQGKVEACTVRKASPEAALNKLACDVAIVLPVAHVTDRAGAPVRSVAMQTVMFAVDPGKAR